MSFFANVFSTIIIIISINIIIMSIIIISVCRFFYSLSFKKLSLLGYKFPFRIVNNIDTKVQQQLKSTITIRMKKKISLN